MKKTNPTVPIKEDTGQGVRKPAHLYHRWAEPLRKTLQIPCQQKRFVLHQLREKYWEQNGDLYAAFINLIKAFDAVSGGGFWKILGNLAC